MVLLMYPHYLDIQFFLWILKMNLQQNQEGISAAITDWKTSTEIAPDIYEAANTYKLILDLQSFGPLRLP